VHDACTLQTPFKSYSIRNAGDKEFVGGGLLDSLNFAKQDEKYAAPKVKSGSIAQAMLSKVNCPRKRNLFLYVQCFSASVSGLACLVCATFLVEFDKWN